MRIITLRRAGCTALLPVVMVVACSRFGAADAPDGTDDADGQAPARDGSVPETSAADGSTPPDGPLEASNLPCQGEAACPRVVFVTSALFAGEEIGGPSGADNRCTKLAQAPGTAPGLAGRKWRAWISDEAASGSASARLTHGTKSYRLGDGTVVANDWTQLTAGKLLHAIDRDERGTTVVVGDDLVWTGTAPAGQSSGWTCMSWATGDGAPNVGTVGRAFNSDRTWTSSHTDSCLASRRLYCFEE